MEGGGDDVAGAVEAVRQRVGGAAGDDADPQVGPTHSALTIRRNVAAAAA